MINTPAYKKLEQLADELRKTRKSLVVPIFIDETRSIDHYLVSEIYERLEEATKEEFSQDIDVILHSSGGDADNAYHLATMFQQYCRKGKLSMIIPRYAKSAATLLACGGDVIVMGAPSELGPIDPQVEDPVTGSWISLVSIYNTIDYLKTLEKGPLLDKLTERLPVMEIGDYQLQIKHVQELLEELLVKRMFRAYRYKEMKAKEIAEKLTTGYAYHGRTITLAEANKIGLKTEVLPRDQWFLVWKMYRIFEKEVLIEG